MGSDVTRAAEKATAERASMLASYEAQIEKHATNIDNARVAGRLALKEIHDRELWREGDYKSWAVYCKDRWGMGRSRAYELVAWASEQLLAIEASVKEGQFGRAAPSTPVDQSALADSAPVVSRKQARERRRERRAVPDDTPPAEAQPQVPDVRGTSPRVAGSASTRGAQPPVPPAVTPGRIVCPRCKGEGEVDAPALGSPRSPMSAPDRCQCSKPDPTSYGVCRICKKRR